MPDILARLDQYASITAYEFDEITANSPRITGLGTYYASEFYENVGIGTTLTANVFAPYDPVYDDFGGTLFGPGQGRYMRQNTDKSVVIYNEINEIDLFVTNIPTSGLQLYIDAGISTSFTEIPPVGQQEYTTAQTTTFTVPAGCTSISAVCVGGGGGGGGSEDADEGGAGGGGGALAYQTSIAVTPGESLTVVVGAAGAAGAASGNGGPGGTSSISRSGTNLVAANGGGGGQHRGNGGTGGTVVTGTGGSGGTGGNASNSRANGNGGGGAGAGGYSGNGGNGGDGATASVAGSAGAAGSGAGGGGGSGLNNAARGGSGVGILGTTGVTGNAGALNASATIAGSGGSVGTFTGGAYGGGGAGRSGANTNSAGGAGSVGAVRIIWGTGRSYPSTNTANQTAVNSTFTLSDLSGNGRTASTVPTGEPTYSSIIREGSVVFDGTNDYMTHSGYKGITGTGARTAIIWFRANVPNIAYRLFGWGTTASGGKWNISLDATTFRPRVEIATGSVLANTSVPNITNGEWYMIAASAPASGTASSIKLYIDGNLITDTTVTSGATAINTVSGSDVSFGASLADAAPGYLNGGVSQFLIYNRQLTDLEILQIYKIISTRFFI